MIVGDGGGDRELADADLGLDGAGTIDDHDATRRFGRIESAVMAAADRPSRGQSPNTRVTTASATVSTLTIADHRDEHVVRVVHARWNACRSSRVSAATDSGVPDAGRP